MSSCSYYGQACSCSCRAPKHKRDPIFPFELAEANAILADREDTVSYCAYHLAFTTGMRPSELFGLQSDDIDFDRRTVLVHQQLARSGGFRKLKTAASERTVQITKSVVASLNERRKIPLQSGQASSKLIITNPSGGPMFSQQWGRDHWNPCLKRLKLKHRGFHHVRHTYATLQLRRGVEVHIVARVLGHSSPSQTWNTYAHLMPGDQDRATEFNRRNVRLKNAPKFAGGYRVAPCSFRPLANIESCRVSGSCISMY